MSDTPQSFRLDAFLPYRLSILAEAVSRSLATLYAERFELTIPEWRAMAVLGCFQPLSATAICARTQMDKVRVTRAIARMTDAGLVTGTQDADDRRMVQLRLTARGMAVFADIVPLALAREAELLSALAPEERAMFDRVLGKLWTAISDSTAKHHAPD